MKAYDDEDEARRDVDVSHDVSHDASPAGSFHELQALESLTDAVYTLDHDWRFTYLNGEAERLVHRSREELLGRRVWDEFPEAAASELFDLYHRAAADGEPVRVPAYDYPPLDTVFEINVYPSEFGLAVQFRDVSDHVHRTRQLQRRADDELEVSARLRQLDDIKNTFLSAVSHELRTPLMILRASARHLRELRDEIADEERRELEDTIDEQAERLERLLSDLLDVERLRRGALRSRQVDGDLAAIVAAAAGRHDTAVRVDLDVPDWLPVNADSSQIERIVANLLENAGKYAPEGRISLRLSPLQGGGGRLDVIDEGPGIPVDEHERIFAPLYRIDEDHARPGTGIGLALVAAFAELHGGAARAVPHAGGAHLQVDLPGSVSEAAGR